LVTTLLLKVAIALMRDPAEAEFVVEPISRDYGRYATYAYIRL
jgi:hypothetical protein